MYRSSAVLPLAAECWFCWGMCESLEMDVASVDAELRTLAADEVEVEVEFASMEFRVEAKLCLEVLLRSMLVGREGAANPGLLVTKDAAVEAAEDATLEGGVVEALVVGVMVDEDEMELGVGTAGGCDCGLDEVGPLEIEEVNRPKNREAAVLTSEVCRAALGLPSLSWVDSR